MLQWFVSWFMIYVFLVSEVRCGSSKDEWDLFTIDSLSLTMDFGDADKLASIFGPNCNSSDLFEFEVDWDELISNALKDKPSTVSNDYDSITSTREKRSKVLTITMCSMIAVLAAVALFIYGKGALITYLQSGTYRLFSSVISIGVKSLMSIFKPLSPIATLESLIENTTLNPCSSNSKWLEQIPNVTDKGGQNGFHELPEVTLKKN